MNTNPLTTKPRVEVAAGLVVRQGRLLIARRAEGKHLSGLWEFPGGKREQGETFGECLIRELREELGIDVVPEPDPYAVVEHEYETKVVYLQFIRASLVSGEPLPLECAEVSWAGREELTRFQFPPADALLLKQLREDLRFWE